MSSSSSLQSENGPARIRLTSRHSVQTLDGEGFRLQVVATEAVGLKDNAIFVYQLVPPTLAPVKATTGEFVGVARSYMMAEYGVGLPELGPFPAFYRETAVDLVMANFHDIDKAYESIVDTTQRLLNTVDRLDRLTDPEVIDLAADRG